MTAWEALKDAPRRFGEAASQARPNLRSIVSPPRRIAPIPFAVLMVALLVGGMVGLLWLTTQLQNRAFVVRQAQSQANELGYRVAVLESQVIELNSPASLARQASGLGMVPNPHAVFIDLETGLVIGRPTRVSGGEIPSLTVLPPAPEVPATEASTAAAPPDPAAGTPFTPGDAAASPDAGAAEATPAPDGATAPATGTTPAPDDAIAPTAEAPAADTAEADAGPEAEAEAEVHGDPGVPPLPDASAPSSEPTAGANA